MATQAPTPVADTGRDVRLVGVLLLGLVVVAVQPLPFSLAGIPMGVLAAVLALRALGRLGRIRRAGGRPRGQVALSAGMGLAAVVTLNLLSEAVIYPVSAELESCLAGALTNTARERCETEHQQRLEEFLAPWFERAGLTPP
jgi:hypothetical protein